MKLAIKLCSLNYLNFLKLFSCAVSGEHEWYAPPDWEDIFWTGQRGEQKLFGTLWQRHNGPFCV